MTLDEMLAVAEKATQDWRGDEKYLEVPYHPTWIDCAFEGNPEAAANGKFMITFSPDRIKKLLRVCKAAKAWSDATDGSREQVRAGDDICDALSDLES